MSGASEKPWSDNPNAPKIPLWLHTTEKDYFAGPAVGGIFYGILVTLFFQCIGALINPANKTSRSVKLGLFAYTAALFSFATISLGVGRDMFSVVFIDLRNFPGAEDYPPGPTGGVTILNTNAAYQNLISSPAIVNQWLSDALLLYRCYVIYSMNYWAISLPSLLYVASIGVGIMDIYLFPTIGTSASPTKISITSSAYFGICLALNILLTLMIITKLILHRRNFQHPVGTPNAAPGVYTTIVVMLVESPRRVHVHHRKNPR